MARFVTRSQIQPRAGTLCLAVLALAGGCRRPPADSRVVAVFGSTGLGHGEFSYPRAIAISPAGKVFAVDKTGRIQRFDADGRYETGWRMPAWEKGKPVGLAVHPDGRLFVADTHYSRVLIFDQDGGELARFGREGTGPGEFLLPTSVAFDSDGFVYVAEYGGNDRISKFTAGLEFVTSFGGPESGEASLLRPTGLTFDASGRLWVADACHHRVCCFDRDGRLLTAFGQVGTELGQLRYPYDLAIDDRGRLLVCEYGNNRLQWFDMDGRSLGTWGTPGRRPGQLAYPWSADLAPTGRLYVLDSGNNRVQVLKRGTRPALIHTRDSGLVREGMGETLRR